MNEPVNLPPDAPRDPLLDALRERLGDYGAPPPPGAWAGIQQRLPAPRRPWWRRSRHLLALLLLVVALTGYVLSRSGRLVSQPTGLLASHPGGAPARSLPTPEAPGPEAVATLGSKRHLESITAPTSRTTTALPKARTNSALPATATTSTTSTTSIAKAPLSAATKAAPLVAAADYRRLARATRRAPTQPLAPQSLRGSAIKQQEVVSHSPVSRLAGHSLATAPISQLHRWRSPVRPAPLQPSTLRTNSPKKASRPTTQPLAEAVDKKRVPGSHRRADASQRYRVQPAALLGYRLPVTRRFRQRRTGLAAYPAQRGNESATIAPTPTALATFLSAHSSGQRAASTEAAALASLGLRRAGLLLRAPGVLPSSLAALPDASPAARPARRWALLATAGPTLSYRLIGAAPATLGTRPDFAHLERPALGMGAQVQVRRVLSGRWALAAGLGYQAYATRLALQQVDSGRTTHFSLRDTYRLLTLPIQFSYALGAPRGRLAKGLLLGAEVGWYRGGRSTEGSDCGCRQQTYTASTGDSLYSAKTLALSLGLDLRYRLGGPASRWQWLVQPTGRYVLTPFVKPNTTGFSPRQPFSLGLFTGFSWDIR